MRMDKLTSRFQQALADAQSLAVGRDHNLIEPAHLLVALLDQQGGGSRPLLAQAGVKVPLLRERLGEALDKLPKVSAQAGNVSVGNDLSRLLNVTDKLAQQRGDAFIASELFLLAAIDDGGDAGRALKATGATKQKEGKFELADGGTLFLDEIGNMSLGFQAKILRVLEYQRFERVAGSESILVNVRVIAATNADLKKAIVEGT